VAKFTVHSWHQQPFDNTITPPSPVLSLQIAGPEADDWIDVATALVDTGADATIIPDTLLSQILAVEWDEARLRSHWGEYRLVYRYEIDIRIHGRTFSSILVVADDTGHDVVLGRDLLTRLRFFYDGPAQQFILVA
jgi:predicted aspartyl protease